MSPAVNGSRFWGGSPLVPVTLWGLEGSWEWGDSGGPAAAGPSCACAQEPLAQFAGRWPCLGIPAVGVPALPAAVGGGIPEAGGQFPPLPPTRASRAC